MSLKSVTEKYFDGFNIIKNKDASKSEKTLAKISIASYFFVIPPLIFAAGLGLSKVGELFTKKEKKIQKKNPDSVPLDKTINTQAQKWINGSTQKTGKAQPQKTQQPPILQPQSHFGGQVDNNPPQPAAPIAQPQLPENRVSNSDFPVITNLDAGGKFIPGQFVQVLNAKGYEINGKEVKIPPASRPLLYQRATTFDAELDLLRVGLGESASLTPIPFRIVNQTTEEAINACQNACIALNFANEHHAGGGPGIHKDPSTGNIVYDGYSAKAQEESMCQRTDLFVSLTQLPHSYEQLPGDSPRSYYNPPFDSRTQVYTSENTLFATQNKNLRGEFYYSNYVEQPKPVTFITSAAKNYAGESKRVDCSKQSQDYLDARQRIETHLLASAAEAVTKKANNPGEKVTLILGAFGCGAFVPPPFTGVTDHVYRNFWNKDIPSDNRSEYRAMIADIYNEILIDNPKFSGFFDEVVFAIPDFGQGKESAATLNCMIFEEILHIKM